MDRDQGSNAERQNVWVLIGIGAGVLLIPAIGLVGAMFALLPARDGEWRSALSAADESANGETVFALDVDPQECGQFATEIRIYPYHELLSHPYELGLMKWL